MSDSSTDAILGWISQNPGQRASRIAAGLELDRKTVNAALHGPLRRHVRQDDKFCWWVADGSGNAPERSVEALPDSKIGRLARYFLEAVARDVQLDVSVYASSKFDDLDYADLPLIPALSDEPYEPGEKVRRLVGKGAKSRTHTLYVGYPILVRKIRNKKGNSFRVLEPLLLLPFGADGRRFEVGRIAFNHAALKYFSPGGPSAAVAEAMDTMAELGLRADAAEQPDLDDVLFRLPDVRPDWPWVERYDPYRVEGDGPLRSVDTEGIVNRAAVFLVDQPRYTAGLESELEALSRQPDERLAGSALGAWIEERFNTRGAAPRGVLEVVSLNAEQRLAVQKGLVEPLTVITGPPGTGKSQVVTALLVNAVWNGQTVLFASRNNKAVDVVEQRVNALADRPVMVRLGAKRELMTKLAEQLGRLLAAGTDAAQAVQLETLRRQGEDIGANEAALRDELAALMHQRNRVSDLENELEPLRRIFGEAGMRALRMLPVDAGAVVDRLDRAARSCDPARRGMLANLFWPLLRKGREAALAEARLRCIQTGLAGDILPDDNARIGDVLRDLRQRVAILPKVAEYIREADRLKSMPADTEIALRLRDVQQQKAQVAEPLWRLSLAVRAAGMSSEERRAAANYASALQLQLADDADQAMPRIDWLAMLNSLRSVIPCWAVTALSAKGRLPYDAGIFDLVVIDEASQCDIASVLPLLMRAKRAVVLGDPMQLAHITTLSASEDARLLQHFGLADTAAYWSFTRSSLFHLAAALSGAENVVALRDHHRSHPDIIGFSNRYFYEGRLRVATRHDRLILPPRTDRIVTWQEASGPVTRHVAGGAFQQATARATVDALRGLLVERDYRGTVGIVTPFRAQRALINELIGRDAEVTARSQRADLLVDVVHSFQGDERDVMLFSVVCGPGMTEGALGFLRSNGNLFNVAITRARAALIVVGDKDAAAHSGVPYLEAFTRYVDELSSASPIVPDTRRDFGPEYPRLPDGAPPVSEEERILYRALYAAGLRPVPQHPVEAYRLDLALLAADRKLDIEVDGRRHHQRWDGERVRRDEIRNQRLIELGWEICRFWGSQVRDDPEECVRTVLNRIGRGPDSDLAYEGCRSE